MCTKNQKVKRGAFEDADLTPYKKTAKTNPPKKANHKHEYEPVILEYWGEHFNFSPEKGFTGGTGYTEGSRCCICEHLRLGFPKKYCIKNEKTLPSDLPIIIVEDIWNLR